MPQDGTVNPENGKSTPIVPKPGQEAGKIRAMFDSIAFRYDLLNHLLSGGTDIAWRRFAVKHLLRGGEKRVLDLACGTGDLALELKRRTDPRCEILGVDFSAGMLRLAHKKTATPAHQDRPIHWLQGDGLRLPFPDNSFDLVTIAFGIRNMESLDGALEEIHRVLRPGGRLGILEFSQPENRLVRTLYMPYFLHVLPRIGALLSQRTAYLYLPFSVLHFPDRFELAKKMRQSGYGRVRHCPLTLGIAALHMGDKK
ncbi:MAG: bifunctional demethylmenaquinone methyltransferase/2-methoxy-6-polyprenyl-1,4-benzoquinol methylase UbiE [Candidatus Sumerlaeia bacterium]|nr:bifunctional demethylmenaquinone methyltransferase/2-methoxy-6-polyprenyl-1,4-benzoquinol methylase UbiE [Candidatus Sumerlaeia bacterium]